MIVRRVSWMMSCFNFLECSYRVTNTEQIPFQLEKHISLVELFIHLLCWYKLLILLVLVSVRSYFISIRATSILLFRLDLMKVFSWSYGRNSPCVICTVKEIVNLLCRRNNRPLHTWRGITSYDDHISSLIEVCPNNLDLTHTSNVTILCGQQCLN